VQEFSPVVRAQVPAPDGTFDFLRAAMTGVTAEGTGRVPFEGFPLDEIPIAAKTGSAQVFSDNSTTAWFASFAPANDPQYAVVMMVTRGGTGSLSAGPGVRAIYDAIFGVQDGVADPARSVLIGAEPSRSLPIVRPDGTPITPEADE
jgi:penicillin-binding protein 2